MTRRVALPAWFDKNNPIAPTEAQWAALDQASRDAVCAALPFVVENDFMSEGDAHARAVLEASQQLEARFGGGGPGSRRFYIGRSVMVHYPGKSGFAPDLFLVFDVPDHDRKSYVVLAEGKGLDFALEVHDEGDLAKDLKRNVTMYAELGIPEYFVLDINRRRLHGFRLARAGGHYDTLIPQGGQFESEVLGLSLGLEGTRVRFFYGKAALPTDKELRARLEASLAQSVEAQLSETQRAEAEAQRAATEAQRAAVETQRAAVEAQRAAEAEARVRALEARIAELERLARN